MNHNTIDKNLALTLRDNLLKAGARSTVSFLNKGETDKAVSLSGNELHHLAIGKAACILEQTAVLSKVERPVVLAMTPGLDFVTSLFACIYAGVTIVTVPVSKSRIALERLRGIIDDCGAVDVLTDQVGASAFDMLASENDRRVLNVVCLPQNNELAQQTTAKYSFRGFSKEITENAFVQYTSGSSKNPKGVVLSDRSVLHNSALVGELWGFDEDTILGNWLPHYHDMGLMGGMFYSLLNGGRLVLMSPMAFAQKPVRWLQMISACGVTVSGAPPFAFNLCLNHKNEEDLAGLDLSSWKVAYCGAETVFRDVLDKFRKKFSPMGLDPSAVFSCYGMAEITVFAGGQPSSYPDQNDPMPNSLVEPCVLSEKPLNAIKVVNPETGVLLEDGQKGEIWLQSDSLGKGYLSVSDSLPLSYHTAEFQNSLETLEGDWFRTGDLAVKQGNHLYVHGRIKDTIIVNGVNLAAADIEWYAGEVNSELNGLGAAAFTSRNDQEGRAHLLIEVKNSRVKGVDLQEVEEAIRLRVRSLFSVELDEVLILKRGTLDRTSSGKVRRMQIARNFDPTFYEASVLN